MKDPKLQKTLKAFRMNNELSQEAAAHLLGIPVRTIEYVESGRGFRYPKTLLLAMRAVELTLKPYE